jgi:hypothetical protein
VVDGASGEPLTDHLWITIGAWAFGFRPGDQVEFTAEVVPYVKGWLGDSLSPKALDRPSPAVDWGLDSSTVKEARVIAFGPEVRMMADGSIRGGSHEELTTQR